MKIENVTYYGIDTLLDKDSKLAREVFYDLAKEACSYYLSSIHNNEELYEYLAEILQNILITEYKEYGLFTYISLTDRDDSKEIIINLSFGKMTVTESIDYFTKVEYY